jgi:hypothetical protein
MIINTHIIENKFRCKDKRIEEYLMFKCHIPILGFDEKYFYFAHTVRLEECLKRMPLKLKILLWLERR